MNRLVLLAALGAALTAAPAAHACVRDQPANGTGYKPGSSTASLPQTTPRPGPEILYRDAPRAPQLENTGIWQAAPVMVSGASAYRGGEFLYQDFLYDEAALTYPGDPATHGDNAADLVELRLRLRDEGLAVRLTYNTMLDPSLAATTLALGGSGEPRPMPHDAGASMPASVFVTVHGCAAEFVSAADGKALPHGAPVEVDRERRQVEVLIPFGAFDPRGQSAVRVGAATGLWDAAAGRYQRPDPEAPAFFNVAFRFAEPFVDFRNSTQNAALASGDLSPFFATVDFTKLAAGVDDDSGVPAAGRMSRIFASHFETAHGRGSYRPGIDKALTPGYEPCHAPCSPQFAGRLQPYSVYVPDRPRPPGGWRLALYHHGCGENYNTFIDRAARFADLDGGSAIAVLTQARGLCIWEYEQAGADLYEAWADTARNFRLDPERVTLSGQSLGGYASWKNIVQFPDLFAASAPNIAPPSASGAWAGRPVPAQSGEGTVVYPLLRSLRHVPVIHWVSMQDELVPYTGTQAISDELDALGYRHSFRAFTGEHATTGLFLADYDPMGDYIANRTVQRDPAHVSYVVSRFMHQPQYGLDSDHAYWLSDLRLRDDSGAAPLGTIDAVSHGRAAGDPPVVGPTRSAGMYPLSTGGAPVPYHGVDVDWGPVPPAPRRDLLEIRATNLRSVTVWARRAGLSCNPDVRVESASPLEVRIAGCEQHATPPRPLCTSSTRLVLPRYRGRVVRVTARVNGRSVRIRRLRNGRRYLDLRRYAGRRARIVVTVRVRRGGTTRPRVLRRNYRLCGISAS